MNHAFKGLFALVFILVGLLHFLSPGFFVQIVPPYLPWPLFLVYASGFFEVLFGVLLLVPSAQRLAAWGLIALLIAVFPANLYMALHSDLYPGVPALLLWLRLPLQFALVAWAYRYARLPAA